MLPDLPADDAYEELWRQIEHVLRLDEPDPELLDAIRAVAESVVAGLPETTALAA